MKRIGIIAPKSQDNGTISIAAAYASFFSNFGMIVPIFTYDEYVNTQIDLLVLVGGADVYPERYGKKPNFNTQNPNIGMEWFDTYMLPQYIQAGVPIFGICRGFQTLNVHFGGTLSQHIKQAYSTSSRADKVDELTIMLDGVNKCVEYGIINDNQRMNLNVRRSNFKVNSLHHQGVFMDDLAETEGVKPLLMNEVNKNIEAIQFNEITYGVQWHPEEIYDMFSMKLIRELLA